MKTAIGFYSVCFLTADAPEFSFWKMRKIKKEPRLCSGWSPDQLNLLTLVGLSCKEILLQTMLLLRA